MTDLFDFNDILIEPTILSPIRSRKEINTKHINGMFPLMTAPMDTVVGYNNKQIYNNNGIISVLPRNGSTVPIIISFDEKVFQSYGLDEFNDIFINNIQEIPDGRTAYVLIDIANGHMVELYNSSKKAKELYGSKLCLMVGNVANPQTFYEYAEIGVDYVRIGIGNGGGCLTTVQTGVGYPMASLIRECAGKKWAKEYVTKIVADGGFKNYSDIIKALSLGADYVMLGSILNKCLESSGETTKRGDGLDNMETVDQFSNHALDLHNVGIPLFKTFRGMSTKEVQKSLGKVALVTSEGITKQTKVEYTIKGWTDNFDSYLRSAMSYTGKRELHQFIGGVKINFISQNSYNRFNK